MKQCNRSNRDVRLRPVYTREEIAAAVQRMADEIARDYNGGRICLIVVLKGAFVFAADLVRRLLLPVEIDFVKLASYNGLETSGNVKITKDIETTIAGKDVLVVEDIVDTGTTLDFLLRHLAAKRPKSLRLCALIDKPERRRVAVRVDYTGLACKNGFLVGYGLDFDDCCRELEAIYEVTGFLPAED